MGGAMYDAPNQQVVRDDGSGPGIEAEAREEAAAETPAAETPAASAEPDLDEMTKEELLEHARAIGATPANASMTKDELRDAIEDAEGA